MAQHITDESRRMESRDAHELELLLEEEERTARTVESRKNPFKRLLLTFAFPKEWAFAAVLTITGLAVAGYWLGVEEPAKPEFINQILRNQIQPDTYIQPQYIFAMKPFFLPKKENGKETGQFIRVSINLQLSDSFLDREVKKVLPLLRQNVYTILKRKRSKKFYSAPAKAEETLKREVLTVSNSLLISGSGTITDVFFTEFLIRSS